jgi:4-hydroxy-tetrahydrodipicolinate synthase
MMKNLNVAIPTPFHDDESLFLEGFKPIVEHLKNNGIGSILICGTTGEQHSLSINERLQIIEYFNQQNFQDIELMFSVSATRTSDAIKLIQELKKSVFNVIVISFPPYILPTQHQAVYYVDELIKHTSKQVVLYNNPSRTGFDLGQAALQQLVTKHTNIIGLKEGGDISRHRHTNFPEDFILFAAGDVDLPEMINYGCSGLSSMVGNVYPKEIKQAFNDLLEHKSIDLNKFNHLIKEVTQKQTIVNIKNHYNSIGLKVGTCRSPIIQI